MRRKLMEDESGVNVLVEYIINFGVLLVLLTIVLVLYQSIITGSSNAIAHEEYRIFANDLANRIVLFDRMIDSTCSLGGSIDDLELAFDAPAEIAGMAYTIDLDPNGVEIASAESAAVDPIRATFNTKYPVCDRTIYGYGYHKIWFNTTANRIEVT